MQTIQNSNFYQNCSQNYNNPNLKTCYIKNLGFNETFSILSLSFIKDYLKISNTDTSHDSNLTHFKKVAVETAQKYLSNIIIPTNFRMIIGTFNNQNQHPTFGILKNIYYNLNKSTIFGGNIQLCPKTKVILNNTTSYISGLLIPVKPIISVNNISVDGASVPESNYTLNNFESMLYCSNLEEDFQTAQIEFTSGFANQDDISQDIINAILNHIFFMWSNGDLLIDIPQSSLSVYKAYQQAVHTYRT